MKFNKKGMAFEWIYGLIFLFALGLIFIVFNEVLEENVYDMSNDLIPDSFEGKADIVEENNKWMNYWQLMPIIIFFIIIIYLIVQGIGSGA